MQQAKLNGEDYDISGKVIADMPGNFKSWAIDNAERIEKAKSLLETTSLKTGKIAMMVGYRDTNYFSLAFKKHTGKSPTKYREEMQK